VQHLARNAAKIDDEVVAHGRPAPYEFLAVGPTGERLHPDTLTRHFNRLVDRAGVPRIDYTMFGGGAVAVMRRLRIWLQTTPSTSGEALR
jgi:hypothetical protein